MHKSDVAKRLGVDPRTIQNYITEAQVLGLPLVLDRGVCRMEREMRKMVYLDGIMCCI